MIILLN